MALQVVSWVDIDGVQKNALIEYHDDVQELIVVQLRGRFQRFGVRDDLPSGYSDVMRNRATCFGTYPDIYWTEFGVFFKRPSTSVPPSLAGQWRGSGMVDHGIAGDTLQLQCTMDDVTASAPVAITLEGIYISRSVPARLSAKSQGLEYAMSINDAPQRQIIAYDPDSGILMTRQVADRSIHCMYFVASGDRAVAAEWVNLQSGALVNPCDGEFYSALGSPKCLGAAGTDRFFGGLVVFNLELAAAPRPRVSSRSTAAMFLVLVVLQCLHRW